MAEHLITIKPADGDDTICTAHILDWSCLILRTSEPAEHIEIMHGDGTPHDAVLVIPDLMLQSLGDKLIEVLPRLVGFAYEHEM